MTQPLLSIQIPCTPDRVKGLIGLLKNIPNGNRVYQTVLDAHNRLGNDFICNEHIIDNNFNPLQIVVYCDDRIMTIGEKREKLYQLSKCTHSFQVDSDDEISDNAIELILETIKSNLDVDCITFEEYVEIDGRVQRSNHSLKYEDWADRQDGYDYVRTPFMKSVIKTEIAKNVPIPHIRFGEDHQWAQALKPHLKTEIHINQQLYRYIHISTPHNERYGIDK